MVAAWNLTARPSRSCRQGREAQKVAVAEARAHVELAAADAAIIQMPERLLQTLLSLPRARLPQRAQPERRPQRWRQRWSWRGRWWSWRRSSGRSKRRTNAGGFVGRGASSR